MLILYIASFIVSLAIGIVACRRRAVPGARRFALYALAEASMTLGFIIELLSPGLGRKIFWDNFQFIGSTIAPLAFLAFTFQYTERTFARPKLTWWGLGILATIFILIVYTDPLHGLIRPESYLVPRNSFDVLVYDYTLTFWAYTIFIYGMLLYCLGIFVGEFVNAQPIRRTQVGTILIGMLFPYVSMIISMSGLEFGLSRDVTPFGFALGNLAIAWGLFRHRLFDLVPVARKTVMTNMADAVMVVDAEHRVVDLNTAAETLLGRSASELLGQPTKTVFSEWPELVERFYDVQEESSEIAYTISGEKYYADLRISPVYNNRGHLAGRVVVARDITDRKQAEKALQQSEERYRFLIENSNDYILRINREGKVVFATEASRRLHGYAPRELVGSSGFNRIHPDDREEAMAVFKRAMERGEDTRHEYRLRHKEGGYVWVETTGRVVHNKATGEPEAVLVARDITARKRAEAALQGAHEELERRVEERTAELRESEDTLKRAQQVSHTGSWHLDILKDALIWSDETYRIFGIPQGTEMTYSAFLEYVHPDDRPLVDEAWENALDGKPYDIEHRIIVDGKEKWVHEQAEVEFDAEGRPAYAVGIVQDITARKQAAEALHQYTTRLRTLYQISKGIIAAQSPKELAQVAVDYIRQLIPCQGVLIAVGDGLDHKVTFLAADLDMQTDTRQGYTLSESKHKAINEISDYLQRGQHYIMPLERPRSFLSTSLYTAGARAICYLPLLVQQDLVGAMIIGMTDTDTLTDEQLAITRRVADQLAIALYQARLYQQAQQYAQELEQSNRALALVNEASRMFAATLDEKRVFDVILEKAHHLLNVDVMAVWLPDPDTEDLICHRVVGLPADRMQGWHLPLGEGIAGWVAQHGEALIVADLQDDERRSKMITERAGIAYRSLLSVPLHFKDKTTGVIQAVDMKPDYFDAGHLALLEPLAASAVTAIENARLFEEVRLTREQLRALSRKLVGIQETERAAVARELHDEAGQSLSYLLLSLGILKREADDAAAVTARAEMIEEMIESLLENLHRMAARLRPAALEHLGLIPALEQYIETFIHQSSISTQFEVVGLKDKRLSSATETALYRVAQEALTNVTRHAQASHVDVLLELRGSQVVLIVEDNGIGFDAETAAAEGRLGLVGMRERAQMLSGTWTIESTPGEGTTIAVEVPYDHSDFDR